jgi:hypothetical protein
MCPGSPVGTETKWDGTHQLLVCADDVNLLRDNTDTINITTDTLTNAGLKVNIEKTKYMLLSGLLEMPSLAARWHFKQS